jgi:hypothetical protein
VKTRIMARHQQVARFDHETDAELPAGVGGGVVAQARALLAGRDVLVLEDYNKGCSPARDPRRRRGGRRRRACPWWWTRSCATSSTIAAPRCSSRTCRSWPRRCARRCEADDAAWLEDVRQQLGCDHLLVTLGEDGMALLTAAASTCACRPWRARSTTSPVPATR